MDKIIEITRYESSNNGTFGRLYIDGAYVCETLEDPWNDNHHGNSCIPRGVYPCIPHGWEDDSPVKFKRVWEVTHVQGRSAILIHEGNTIEDTHGCILVGSQRGALSGRPAILKSRQALSHLRDILPVRFTLVIGGVAG